MKKVMIVYASMTGNTEMMAESIADGIRSQNNEVVLKEAYEIDVDELLAYDGLLIGAYTWNNGNLPDEFLDFYEDMEGLDLSGKKAAVFGSGDTMYEYFGAAVDTIEERLIACGAELVQRGLKVELTPELAKCREFGVNFANTIAETK